MMVKNFDNTNVQTIWKNVGFFFNKSSVQNPAVVDKTYFGHLLHFLHFLLPEAGLDRIDDNEQQLQLIS